MSPDREFTAPEEAWSFSPIGGALSPSVVIGRDGVVFASSSAGALYALDPVSGKQRWSVQPTTAPLSAPVVQGLNGTVVVVSSSGGVVSAFNSTSGSFLWVFSGADARTAEPPVLTSADDGIFVVGARGSSLLQLSGSLGTAVWSASAQNALSFLPVAPAVMIDGITVLVLVGYGQLPHLSMRLESRRAAGVVGQMLWASAFYDAGDSL
jgi:outer membrane protein assembly factor BamB